MQKKKKNNFISIAKAIGIILMVAGHSGCPAIMNSFLYLFHMPLFFIIAGILKIPGNKFNPSGVIIEVPKPIKVSLIK